jgi:hypothetical protein
MDIIDLEDEKRCPDTNPITVHMTISRLYKIALVNNHTLDILMTT